MARFTLTNTDTNKWKRNVIRFLIPLGLMYFTLVIGAITNNGGLPEPEHFIPSQVALGGMILYVLNSAYDILTKYLAK